MNPFTVARRILLLAGLGLLAASGFTSGVFADDDDAANAADEAVRARFEVDKLTYEKLRAERQIKSSDLILQMTDKSLPQLKANVEKAMQEKHAAQETLTAKTAAAEAAKAKAAESKSEDDAAAAKTAEQERLTADQQLRQKDQAVQREAGTLQRNEERYAQNQKDKAAAQKLIPEKEAELVVARQAAEATKARASEADRERAREQDPRAVAVRVDAEIDSALAKANVTGAAAASDAEFLRRATLDITGVIPKYEDVVAFLADSSPDKRSAAIDRLLAEPAYGRNLAQRFCTVTTETGTSTLNQARDAFNDWLAESLNANRRWSRVVTEMLSADGNGYAQPAALFTVAYRMNEQPDPALLLGAAGDHFLGLQIQCAQCHDHPFQEWTHAEFWSMAAMFGRVRLKGNVQNGREVEYLLTDDDVNPKELVRMNGILYRDQLAGGVIEIPDPVNAGKSLRTVSAKFLDGSVPELPEKGNYRKDFARWVTAAENPYFARATANRLWAHFFGRGIVEPIVNLDPENAPSHPELLKLLAAEFTRSNFDLKHLVRCITLSQAYQRTSKPPAGDLPDPKLFSHMALKPLDSYVLLDSLYTVLRRTPPTGQNRRDAAALYDTRLPGGDPRQYTHSIPQVLKLMNTRDYAENNPTVQTATNGKSPPEAVTNLFLAVLGRPPADAEREEMLAYLNALGEPRRGYPDVFWVLLNSAEFLVNH